MRYGIKMLTYPFLFLGRMLSYLVPRNKNIWVFGTPKKFEGNSKYLFLYIQNLNQQHIETAWITRDKKLLQELRKKKYKTYYFFSLQGIFYCLRAKYYVVDTSVEVISYWLSGGAKLINLFHALPIKKMERDVMRGDSSEVALFYSKGIVKILMHFLFPWRFVKPEYVASTSPLYTKIFMSMFQVGKDRIMETGFSRNDVLLRDIQGADIGTDSTTLSEMKQIKKENPEVTFFLYAPTFRDTGDQSFIENEALLGRLDVLLGRYNAIFWVKAHPFAKIVFPKIPFTNIRFANPSSDSYLLLKLADVLITDYSSIFIDFLLTGRPEIFFPYDFEKYITKDRELYFDYKDFTPGPKAYTFDEFLDVLGKTLQKQDEYKAKRADQTVRCFTNNDGNSSARTFAFLRSLSS